MPSKKRVTIFLKTEEDKELFELALKWKKLNASKLGKRIISNWLFDNEYQIREGAKKNE